MKFADCIAAIPTFHDLKRTASAHVVDYSRLGVEELRESIIKTTKQYTHPEAVQSALEFCFWTNPNLDHRVLAEIMIADILINESGCLLSLEELDEKISQVEQALLNESNEKKLKDLAGGREGTPKHDSLSLYNFVLETAWQHCDTKSVDETNLLRKLRGRLGVTNREHRLLEAMLGKYPKPHNDLHSRTETLEAIRTLQSQGLVMLIRDDSGENFAAIPEEIALEIRSFLGVEIRRYGYQQMLLAKYVKKKSYLQATLKKCGIPIANESVPELQEKILESVKPSVLIGGLSPRDGLSNEDLYAWCSELHLPVAGTKQERIDRIIEFYDNLEEVGKAEEGDPRIVWYQYFTELASRDIQGLRAQQIVDKDLEIEHDFEAATAYLFEEKLNHPPLKQAGTEHCDGLLSFRDTYIMWDNKSKEKPVNLADHIAQFDRYMSKSEKPVPVFLVIGPDFTPDSEAVAMAYMAENIGRNVALITASDLKELAELWSSESNKRNAEPFPLGLFARSGRFSLDTVKASIAK